MWLGSVYMCVREDRDKMDTVLRGNSCSREPKSPFISASSPQTSTTLPPSALSLLHSESVFHVSLHSLTPQEFVAGRMRGSRHVSHVSLLCMCLSTVCPFAFIPQ